jgi:hypothetical protein
VRFEPMLNLVDQKDGRSSGRCALQAGDKKPHGP